MKDGQKKKPYRERIRTVECNKQLVLSAKPEKVFRNGIRQILIAEILQAVIIAAPVFIHFHKQFEIDFFTEKFFSFFSRFSS